MHQHPIRIMKTRVPIIFLAAMLIGFASEAQVIALTISAISKSLQPADKKLMSNIRGDWIFKEAKMNGENVIEQFEGVLITFPKCKGKEYKSGNCQGIEVYGDEKTEYFKEVFAEESRISITSRKEINKQAKKEDEEYEKIKYELVQVKGVEYTFSFKYKKNVLRIETTGEEHSEFFQLVRPPKEKKKKSQ